MKYAVVLGAFGLLLILLPVLFGSGKAKEEKNENECEEPAVLFAERFASESEERLALLLKEINGVGRVRVMLSVECTEEYVYLCEKDISLSGDGTEKSSSESQQYVIVGGNGDKNVIRTKVVYPKINGAVICCDGGGSAKIRETVARTAATAFDIPVSAVYVTEMKRTTA